MNAPIPHNNLGSLIPEVMNFRGDSLLSEIFYTLSLDYAINIAQIINFVKIYHAETGKPSKEKQERMAKLAKQNKKVAA